MLDEARSRQYQTSVDCVICIRYFTARRCPREDTGTLNAAKQLPTDSDGCSQENGANQAKDPASAKILMHKCYGSNMRSAGYEHQLAYQIVMVGRDFAAHHVVGGYEQCDRSHNLCIP